jgi:hypothetical protein
MVPSFLARLAPSVIASGFPLASMTMSNLARGMASSLSATGNGGPGKPAFCVPRWDRRPPLPQCRLLRGTVPPADEPGQGRGRRTSPLGDRPPVALHSVLPRRVCRAKRPRARPSQAPDVPGPPRSGSRTDAGNGSIRGARTNPRLRRSSGQPGRCASIPVCRETFPAPARPCRQRRLGPGLAFLVAEDRGLGRADARGYLLAGQALLLAQPLEFDDQPPMTGRRATPRRHDQSV